MAAEIFVGLLVIAPVLAGAVTGAVLGRSGLRRSLRIAGLALLVGCILPASLIGNISDAFSAMRVASYTAAAYLLALGTVYLFSCLLTRTRSKPPPEGDG